MCPGLHDELRPGRPRPISDERVAQLVRKRWTRNPRTARTLGVIRQIARQDPAIEVDGAPHLASLWFGTAPAAALQALEPIHFSVEKVRDMCRVVYLHPPENAVVLCVDLKRARIQALERTQPMLPMGLRLRSKGVTHDYRRHGDHHAVCSTGHVPKGKVLTRADGGHTAHTKNIWVS